MEGTWLVTGRWNRPDDVVSVFATEGARELCREWQVDGVTAYKYTVSRMEAEWIG